MLGIGEHGGVYETRADWLNLTHEDVVEPDLPICDPHHHLWEHPNMTAYVVSDLHGDTRSGHNVTGTVFVECGWAYQPERADGFREVGETQWVADHAPGSVIRGIVSTCDLRLPEATLRAVLAEHEVAGKGMFRGIRHRLANDPTGSAGSSRSSVSPAGLALTDEFQRGVAVLGDLGLTFDAWLYHPQIPELAVLARAVPETTIILDHIGGPVGVGTYAGHRAEIMEQWAIDMADLAACPNVVVKVGGIGMVVYGTGWETRERPPTSDEVVDYWGDALNTTIDLFGPDRCMFESNFPVDKLTVSYRVLWNAFKKVSASRPAADREQLFRGTAERVYRV